MLYKAIGIMSGSSLDGLDMAYVQFLETGGKWTYDLQYTHCFAYSAEWKKQLENAIHLSALEYQLLHTSYGHYIGQKVNEFIETNGLHHKVDMIASHGHTTFHLPAQRTTGQIGDGAAIAAETGLPVISDLRALDVALGGQGAPIVPVGEKLLLGNYSFFLNLGGIANLSVNNPEQYLAFDVCPANRVLNMLVKEMGKEFDEGGNIAATGSVHTELLKELNELEYYSMPYPKSLSNDFGTDVVFPIIQRYNLSTQDELRTFTEHIALQVSLAINKLPALASSDKKLLVTGGGALNSFLVKKISYLLHLENIEVIVPDEKLVNYKEALVMALLGVLRWREEYNVLASVTGATKNSVNGAIWMGAEA
jgi:anhydro-N-acetylmuramic acid kinase